MKLKHYSRIITLEAGASQAEEYFPTFHGPIVGVATKLIGADPVNGNENVVMKDGSNEVLQPIDLSFTDIRGKDSFLDSILPVSIDKPSEIRVQITSDDEAGAAAERKVKAYVFFAENTAPGQIVTLKDFM